MTRTLQPMVSIAIIFILSISSLAVADEWIAPGTEKYFSSNKNYYLEVIPPNLGKPTGVENSCVGTLYKVQSGALDEKIWMRRLVNKIAPVSALVTGNGEYVVTFDNWYRMGYGNDVVVIYGKKGDLIRKYSLEDIVSNGEILENIVHSVSSRWWGGNHYIDENRKVLILKVVTNWKDPSEDEAQFRDIRILLRNGDIIGTDN